MKNKFIWAALAVALFACTRNDNLSPGNIKVSGKITQKGSGLAVPNGAFPIDLYAEPNTFLTSTVPDANGNYTLNYKGLAAVMSSGLKIRVEQTSVDWYDDAYLPVVHIEELNKAANQVRNFEIRSLAFIKARFVNRSNSPVTNLRVCFGSLDKPAPFNPNQFKLFAIEGNTNVRLWCCYSQNGVNYSDTYDYFIAGYDTLTQVIYYGQP